jgi:hypothetical protein
MRRSESKPWKVTGCLRLQHLDALVVLVVASSCGCLLVVLECSRISQGGSIAGEGEVVVALRLPLCYAVAALVVVTTIAAAAIVGFGQLQPLVGK